MVIELLHPIFVHLKADKWLTSKPNTYVNDDFSEDFVYLL